MYQLRFVGVIYYGWIAKTMVFEDRLYSHRNKTLFGGYEKRYSSLQNLFQYANLARTSPLFKSMLPVFFST
jgi:hypothetical protein